MSGPSGQHVLEPMGSSAAPRCSSFDDLGNRLQLVVSCLKSLLFLAAWRFWWIVCRRFGLLLRVGLGVVLEMSNGFLLDVRRQKSGADILKEDKRAGGGLGFLSFLNLTVLSGTN